MAGRPFFARLYGADATIHEQYVKTYTAMLEADRVRKAAGLPEVFVASRLELARAHDAYNKGLRTAAANTAQKFDELAKKNLLATAVREDTHTAPHLRSLIHSASQPGVGGFNLGEVALGDLAILGRAINPNGKHFGTYWRAQEFGTGAGGPVPVPSQVGRVFGYSKTGLPYSFFGYFTGPASGNPISRPTAGAGDPAQPIFRSSGGFSGPRGGSGGPGLIHREIQARHFLLNALTAVKVTYRADAARLEADFIARIPV